MRDHANRVVRLAGILLLAGSVVAASSGRESYRNVDDRECPILDAPYRTSFEIDVTYTFPAATGTTGWGDELSVTDVGLWGRLFSWENTLGSELEAQIQWDTMVLEGFTNAGDDNLIHALSMARLFLQWSQRYVNGYGMQLSASPGLYTSLDALDGEAFSCPAGLTLIKAFTPNCALFMGANVYPDFDTTVDPRLGLIYSCRDSVVLQLAYPESRFEYSPARWIRFLMGARLLLWPEYSLGNEDVRERLQYEEGRAFAGIEWGCTERTQISLQGGYAFDRTISFGAVAGDVELEDATFVMIGIGGRL